ncbi:DEKNAAC100378 [Brettanomyces naardenensis]|uniref:Xylulose kinase n=1 Tax=Brettanomyces naardenensis TaxID=13370 RepID=A0A448YEU0_BRENA|nr:DEKNAAC100378 [Brettanomyces naardenensis]
MSDSLFLGFDLSTQQLKVISTYANLKHHKTYKVDFDEDYSKQYGVKKGVLSVESEGEIFAPVAMWIEAVELAFQRMKDDGFPFEKVKAMSGSCQQHGSVYWSKDAPALLSAMNTDSPLVDQLAPKAFTFQIAPNWQDHSTAPEIEAFEKEVGGPQELAEITGSRAHYRFTGPQIRKMATRKDPDLYHKTYRISLVSSFLCSLLSGKIQKLEEGDACGMNLYDINKSRFDDDLLAVAAGTSPKVDGADKATRAKGIAELKEKLDTVEPIGSQNVGKISPYFAKKYGFLADCKVYSFTGDNLATILALPLANNDILVSMGTSTTVLLVTNQSVPSSSYHIMKHPTMPSHFMGMLCYCNGALARENVRDAINEKFNVHDKSPVGVWKKFDSILDESSPLNGKLELGIYFPKGEIIPNAKICERRFKYHLDDKKLVELPKGKKWSVEEDVASIIESQALSCRLRTGPMLDNTGAAKEKALASLHTTDYEKIATRLSAHDTAVLEKLSSRYGDIQSDGNFHTPSADVAKANNVFFVGGSSKNLSIVKKYCEIFGALKGNYRIDLSDACALGGCYKSLWSFLVEKEGLAKVKGYGEWLNTNYNWDDYVDPVEGVSDRWDEYVDGVGMLSLAEQRLEK